GSSISAGSSYAGNYRCDQRNGQSHRRLGSGEIDEPLPSLRSDEALERGRKIFLRGNGQSYRRQTPASERMVNQKGSRGPATGDRRRSQKGWDIVTRAFCS